MSKALRTAVYLMADLGSGDVKIGISQNPELRVKQVESTYAVGEIYLAGFCWFRTKKEALFHEREFHKMYRARRSLDRGGREWFRLSKSEIELFLEGMSLYQLKVDEERGRYRNQGVGCRESVRHAGLYRNQGAGRKEYL